MLITEETFSIIAWVFLLLVVIITAIISVILHYHWREYGLEHVENVKRLRQVYFSVAGFLLIASIISGLL